MTLLFGQAFDSVVTYTTLADASKPTPPDEEYTWNGKYSLRDGSDPRNGKIVPPGNYKVFVSIDGKAPAEGDKIIKLNEKLFLLQKNIIYDIVYLMGKGILPLHPEE